LTNILSQCFVSLISFLQTCILFLKSFLEEDPLASIHNLIVNCFIEY